MTTAKPDIKGGCLQEVPLYLYAVTVFLKRTYISCFKISLLGGYDARARVLVYSIARFLSIHLSQLQEYEDLLVCKLKNSQKQGSRFVTVRCVAQGKKMI